MVSSTELLRQGCHVLALESGLREFLGAWLTRTVGAGDGRSAPGRTAFDLFLFGRVAPETLNQDSTAPRPRHNQGQSLRPVPRPAAWASSTATQGSVSALPVVWRLGRHVLRRGAPQVRRASVPAHLHGGPQRSRRHASLAARGWPPGPGAGLRAGRWRRGGHRVQRCRRIADPGSAKDTDLRSRNGPYGVAVLARTFGRSGEHGREST